jgi:hypothetical protein
MPRFDEVFGDDAAIMKAFQAIHCQSVAAVMLMPRSALLKLKGIGPHHAQLINRLLRAHGLPHRDYAEKMADFLVRAFGSVHYAPLGVLQVTVVRKGDYNYPLLAPLQSISLLEDIEPNTEVGDITKLSSDQVQQWIESNATFGLEVADLDEDMVHLSIRLANLGTRFFDADSTEPRQLHVTESS